VPFGVLAAAIAAAVAATVVAAAQAATAVAEQENQDDNPANVTATETIVIHKNTSKNFFTAKPLIPWYSHGEKMCSISFFQISPRICMSAKRILSQAIS